MWGGGGVLEFIVSEGLELLRYGLGHGTWGLQEVFRG